jgi:multiple sugar transport system ATP-binding protein
MAELQLEEVSRVYPDGSVALAQLSLLVRNGELLALVGPSGSGKSTTLRLVAGLEPVTSGTISIGGRVVNRLPPHERDVAMVFEGDSLYPHLTAGGNLRFGLEMGRVPKPEIDLRVQAESRVLGVARLLGRMPKSLSAGQRQRVAVGRATVRMPAVFLLDEPLTHLDAARRDQLRLELSTLQRGMGVTTVWVTHDQRQAMAIGDRIAVLRGGRLEQVDSPRALYQRPANTFVASFIGTPGMSLLPARISSDGASIDVAGQPLGFPGTPAGPLRRFLGRPVVVGLRPEHVHLAGEAAEPAAPGAAGGPRRLRLTVARVEHLGSELGVDCELDAPAVSVPDAGEPLGLRGGAVLHARLAARAPVRKGEPIEVELDLAELSFFDPETGAALWHPV